MFPFCQLLGYYTLFIQRYGVCFTALSPQRGSSFAVLISAIHLAVHLDKFLLSALVIFVFGGGETSKQVESCCRGMYLDGGW